MLPTSRIWSSRHSAAGTSASPLRMETKLPPLEQFAFSVRGSKCHSRSTEPLRAVQFANRERPQKGGGRKGGGRHVVLVGPWKHFRLFAALTAPSIRRPGRGLHGCGPINLPHLDQSALWTYPMFGKGRPVLATADRGIALLRSINTIQYNRP